MKATTTRNGKKESAKATGTALMKQLLTGIPAKQLGPPRKPQGQRRILDKGGKAVAQVSPYAGHAILENLRVPVKGLAEAGKGGRGRYLVTEADVPKAKAIIQEALASEANGKVANLSKKRLEKSADPMKTLEAKVAKATTPKRSGKRARSRGDVAAKRRGVTVA